MMEAIFLRLVDMSLAAGWLACAVMLLRLLLHRAPRWTRLLLWAMVAVRLICPFTPESALSLIPPAGTIPMEAVQMPPVTVTAPPISDAVVSAPAAKSISTLTIVSVVWLCGMAALLLYMLVSWLRLRRRTAEAVKLEGNVYTCDRIESPFILGVIRPRILLPSGLPEEDLPYVLAHERAHLSRRDHLWKPLGFLLLAVYWFHPVLWAAYVLLCRDIELACDEAVIARLGASVKKPYAGALIRCSTERRLLTACPLAFGEVGVGSRVKRVLAYKKPAVWVIIAAVLVCVIAAVGFLTDPESDKPDISVTMKENYAYVPPVTVEVYINGSSYEDVYFMIDGVRYVITAPPTVSRPEYWLSAQTEDGTKSAVLRMNTDEASRCASLFMMPLDRGQHEYICDIEEFERLLTWQNSGMPVRFDDAVYRIYTYIGSSQLKKPSIMLAPETGFFQFSVSLLSSDFIAGSYTLDEKQLILTEDDGDVYTFDVTEEGYAFNAAKSAKLPTYQSGKTREVWETVPDGALFVGSGAPLVEEYEKISGASLSFDTEPITVEVSDAVTMPPPVLDYARTATITLAESLGGIDEAQIEGIELVLSEQLVPAERVNLYRLTCRLEMRGGAEKSISISEPYFVMLCYITTDDEQVWVPLGYLTENQIQSVYGTPELLYQYGDAYTAAAMELQNDYKMNNIDLYGKPLSWYVSAAWAAVEAVDETAETRINSRNYQIFKGFEDESVRVLFLPKDGETVSAEVTFAKQADGSHSVDPALTRIFG